ncbi:MAG TPA: protein kinase, partial [Minicystis sp.]|nr:protein kinase [Minicystis sp.]
MTAPSALIGRTLAGRFRVTGFIGEGAMACVYRGVQEAEPRDVAIKVMHPHLLSDRTFVGRFKREARAAAQIHHPNSVRILDTGVDEKLLYIAMELLAGQDLFEVLALVRRIAERRAANIVAQVASALSAAHEHGIVHRDLKPENVMLVPDPDRPDRDRVKVLDFGIAKILEPDALVDGADAAPQSSQSLTALTQYGMVVGTPAYMSPEQCRGEAVDARSDIYACGVLLYQLVTGRLPFSGTTAMDFAVAHVKATPAPMREHVPDVHPELEALVLKALAKWPGMRHASAAELGAELTRLEPELCERPFEGRRVSVGPLKLSLSTGATARHATPEPVTKRREDTPTRAAFRTLPSEHRDEVERPSRVETLEAPLAAGVRAATDDDTTKRRPDVTITLRPGPPDDPTTKRRAAERLSDPPPSSFGMFARVALEPDDDEADDGGATEPRRTGQIAEADAPTPLSRAIAPGAALALAPHPIAAPTAAAL